MNVFLSVKINDTLYILNNLFICSQSPGSMVVVCFVQRLLNERFKYFRFVPNGTIISELSIFKL